MRSMLAGRGWTLVGWLMVAVVGYALPGAANEGGSSTFIQEFLAGPGGEAGGCNGEDCHGLFSMDIEVTIMGPAVLGPGETATYTILLEELTNPGQAGAGVHVHSLVDGLLLSDGVLSEDAANTQLTDGANFGVDGELTHVDPALSVGVFSYPFDVTAPIDAQEIELVGAMNAFNNDGENTGDKWNNTRFVVTVPEPAAGLLALGALLTVGALARRILDPRRSLGSDC